MIKLFKWNFTKSDEQWLRSKIDNPGVHEMPTIEEVINYLSKTDDDEPSEKVLGDLIIQYIEDEGLMFDFC